jgi:glycosyltransferase involved in cell wall biosynthesis
VNMQTPLCVCLLTYNRMIYAKATLQAVAEHLLHRGDIALHIADDGSPNGYMDELVRFANTLDFSDITTSNSKQGGYGANYNLAMQSTHEYQYILPLEDDWELSRDLLVEPLLDLLDRYNSIRLGYLGFTGELKATVLPEGMLLLDPNSLEQHVFAGHPRLETREYQRKVGLWPEGLKPGETELAVSGRMEARTGVLWPMNLCGGLGDLFVHIGTVRSYE